MKTRINTQGSVWIAVLVIIAVVVAALLLSGSFNLFSDKGVHGLVSEINHEENYFLLEEIEVRSVAEDGSAEIRTTEYVVSWTEDHSIEPHHPDLLDGGEMVRVVPSEPLEEEEVLITNPETVEVTRGRDPVPEEADNFEVEETATTTPAE